MISDKKKQIIKKGLIPTHIAIIMDGNGRWAKEKSLPRIIGHKNGIKAVRSITNLCSDLEVKYLTLYTFSIENLDRPKIEVSNLMSLLGSTIKNEINKIKKNNIKLNVLGFIDRLPPKINKLLKDAMTETSSNTGLNLNLALVYSSRMEILNATRQIGEKLISKEICLDDINESLFKKYLFTAEMPDPDLLIRTGNENRLSNFLLWQSAYTELYFTKKYWPDFNEEELLLSIEDFQKRDRRFGKIK